MSNEKIIDNNDEMRLDGMSEVNIDKMVDASEHHHYRRRGSKDADGRA